MVNYVINRNLQNNNVKWPGFTYVIEKREPQRLSFRIFLCAVDDRSALWTALDNCEIQR